MRKHIRQVQALVMIAASSLAPHPARAEDPASGSGSGGTGEARASDVVFEVQEGTCSRVADEYTRAIFSQLQKSGRAAVPSAVQSAADGLIPLPGMTDPTMTVSKIRAKFGEAQQKTTGKEWNFDTAIALYEEGFRWAAENQAIVVKDLDTPSWMTEALVGYATALTRVKKTDDAREKYKAQFVSFPDLPVTSSRFGPTAATQYDDARKELDGSPHGTLLVTVNRPDATIFVDYVGRGRGGNFQANVVAGTYEVLVEVGGKSLRYVVHTDPATTKHAELSIDWDIDSRLVVGDASACVEHVTNTRDVLAGLQRKFPGRSIVLVSRPVRDAVRWVHAERYEPGKTAPLPPCVAPEGDNVGRRIADCIDGKRGAGVFTTIPEKPREAGERAQTPSQLRPWLGLAVTVSAAGMGLFFASIDGTCAREDASLPGGCAEERHMWIEEGVSLAVCAAALGYTVYSYNQYANAFGRKPTTGVGIRVTHAGGVVTLSGSF